MPTSSCNVLCNAIWPILLLIQPSSVLRVGVGKLTLHQLLSDESLPHFDINNLSVAQKLKKLEIGPFHFEL